MMESESERFSVVNSEQDYSNIVRAEDDTEFISVDELQQHGIGVSDINKLKAGGICSIKVKDTP